VELNTASGARAGAEHQPRQQGNHHRHISLEYIALIFASSSVYAAAALGIAVKLFQREDVLFRKQETKRRNRTHCFFLPVEGDLLS
jgi:hypothetical protein